MDSRYRDRQYDLHVDDGGDHWVVFQSMHGYPRRQGDALIVMAGGGGLEMEIAKCDGSITHLHWSR
ncbi:MAG: hypothetical protein KDA35_00320 [Hyphomonadaceae bacterium]|nr:hypothetical protein [Hyphomonadaceae bacterium]